MVVAVESDGTTCGEWAFCCKRVSASCVVVARTDVSLSVYELAEGSSRRRMDQVRGVLL